MMFTDSLFKLMERGIEEGHLARRDVLRLVCSTIYDPEWVRLDLRNWLSDTGVYAAMGADARPLSPCPFSEKELRDADERNEIPLVAPAGLRRQHLAKAYNMQHWVFTESDVTSESGGNRDEWMLVSAGEDLFRLGESCVDAAEAAKKTGQGGLAFEEYTLFAHRLRHLTGKYPDTMNWTWLPKSSYVSSLVLSAGFPGDKELFLNVWPWTEFHSNVGLRLARRRGPRP